MTGVNDHFTAEGNKFRGSWAILLEIPVAFLHVKEAAKLGTNCRQANS